MRNNLLLSAGVCLGVALITWQFRKQEDPTVSLGLTLLSTLVGALAIRLFWRSTSYFFGDRGERKTLSLLFSLPDTYTAITNWVVPGTKQGDIDLLVLGPHGVLVVEIKTYSCKVEATGDKWYQVMENGYRKPIKSLSSQTKRNRRVIAKLIEAKGLDVNVTSALVFNDRADINCKESDVTILHRSALAEYIQRLPASRKTISSEALMN